MSWDEVYGAVNQMIVEAYEAGQMDVRKRLTEKLHEKGHRTVFSKDEILEIVNEMGKEDYYGKRRY